MQLVCLGEKIKKYTVEDLGILYSVCLTNKDTYIMYVHVHGRLGVTFIYMLGKVFA